MGEVEVKFIFPERSMDELSESLRELTAAIEAKRGEAGDYGLGGEHGYGEEWDSDIFEMHRFNWSEDCSDGCPYFWAEWEEHVEHTPECYQTELRQREIEAGLDLIPGTWEYRNPNLTFDKRRALEDVIYTELCEKYGQDREFGAAVHCTCDFDTRYESFHAEHSVEHMPSCQIVRPNFRHKSSGLTVRWYKWIGRDNEVEAPAAVDFRAVFAECIASVCQEQEEEQTPDTGQA